MLRLLLAQPLLAAARATASLAVLLIFCVLTSPSASGEALTPAQARARGNPSGSAEAEASSEAGDSAETGRVSVLVHLRAGADRRGLRALARGHGARVRHEYKRVLPRTINIRNLPRKALAALRSMPGVEKVVEDRYYPNLIKLHDSTPWVRALQTQLDAAGLPVDGSGVRICIVDTGIDSNHLMYADRIDTAAGFDFANDDADPEDDNGHGSHVAGVAVGATGLSADFGCVGPEPFQGVAPRATLIGVKALDRRGGGRESNIIAGIEHCVDPNLPNGPADVINLSLGTDKFESICDGQHSWADAANAAVEAGAVVVAAAGNDGFANALTSPACASGVIAVGASYDESFPSCEDPRTELDFCLDVPCLGSCTDVMPAADDLVCFSNRSELLDVTAPGCNIFSAESSDRQGNALSARCGTSMAAPHVAGLAALLLERDPTLEPSQVRELIRQGATDLGTAGFDIDYGYGRVDILDSLDLIQPDLCGNGLCGIGESPCGCPADCGSAPTTELVCTGGADADCDGLAGCADPDCALDPACTCDGNGICEAGEDCRTCPEDCPLSSGAVCGNAICEVTHGESCLSCPSDCGGKQSGPFSGRFCCGDGAGQRPVGCGDARCTSEGLECSAFPSLSSCCGDGACQAGESATLCALDCRECDGSADCDDGDACNGAETCDEFFRCRAGKTPLEICDGLDNDCDGSIDEGAREGSCECGDLTLDGVIDLADVVLFRAALVDSDSPLSPAAVAQCTVIGEPRPCDILDAAVLRRAVAVDPLPPGIAPVCGAATPP